MGKDLVTSGQDMSVISVRVMSGQFKIRSDQVVILGQISSR